MAAVQDGNHLMTTTISRAATSSGLIPAGPAGAVRSRGWSPTDESGEGVNGCRVEDAERSGDEGPTFSLHSQEGDTEAAIMVTQDIPPCMFAGQDEVLPAYRQPAIRQLRLFLL